jgi:hypothetical protein
MGRILICIWGCLLCVYCAPAHAGAWLQDQGRTFLAASSTTRLTRDGLMAQGEGAVYGEHGLSKTLTFGADVNVTADSYGHAIGFLRRPIGPQTKPVRLAYEAGAGARRVNGEWDPVVRLGLSFGHGITRPVGYGWFGLDSSVEIGTTQGDLSAKLDATLGLPLSARLLTLVQIETTHWPDNTSVVAITPSLLWEFRADRFVKLGIEARSAQTDTLGLRIGFWHEF